MSVEHITWALRQPVSQSSAKFVLVVLANCASADTGIAYPSIAYLAQSTGQDRKTVVRNLARLSEWGLIEDTGKRVGATKQIIVYRVLSGPDLFGAGEEKRNSSENGTVPKTPGNSTAFPPEQSQKRYTEPSGNIRNRQREGASPSGSRLTPDWEPSAEDLEFARRTRPEIDVPTEAAKFRDHWTSTAGAKGRKADWSATWRNWIRRADAPKGAPGQPVQGSAAPKAPPRDWREPAESPLETELAHIRQLHGYGAFGEGPDADAERDRRIEAALRQHGTGKREEGDRA